MSEPKLKPRAVFELNKILDERIISSDEALEPADSALSSFNSYSDIGQVVIRDGPAGSPCFYYKLPRLDNYGNRKKSCDYIPATKDVLEYALLHGAIWTQDGKVLFRIPKSYLELIVFYVGHSPEKFPSIPMFSMREITQTAESAQ